MKHVFSPVQMDTTESAPVSAGEEHPDRECSAMTNGTRPCMDRRYGAGHILRTLPPH